MLDYEYSWWLTAYNSEFIHYKPSTTIDNISYDSCHFALGDTDNDWMLMLIFVGSFVIVCFYNASRLNANWKISAVCQEPQFLNIFFSKYNLKLFNCES